MNVSPMFQGVVRTSRSWPKKSFKLLGLFAGYTQGIQKKNLTLAVVSAVLESMGGDKHLCRMTSDEEDGLTTDAFLLHVRCVIAVSSVICGRTCPVWSQYYCQSSEVCSCKFLYQKSYNISHINTALQQSDTTTPRFYFLRAVPRS